MRRLALLVLFGVPFLFPVCDAQEVREWEGGQVELDLLVVQMPEEIAVPLIPELRDKKRSSAAAEKVLQFVADKKAVLIGWPVLATKSGQRAVVEQVDEIRYPTEYEAPSRSVITKSIPDLTEDPSGAILGQRSGQKSSTEPASGSTTAAEAASSGAVDTSKKVVETTTTVSEGVPAAFETRNVGVTFEVEPRVAPDEYTIELNLVPQHVRFLRMRKVEMTQKESGKKVVVEQPEVLNNRVTTSIQVADGEHTLLGVFKLEEPPGTMELFILHTQLQRIDVPAGRVRTVPKPVDTKTSPHTGADDTPFPTPPLIE